MMLLYIVFFLLGGMFGFIVSACLVAARGTTTRIKFGIKKMGGDGPLDPPRVSLYYTQVVNDVPYGNYITYNCGGDDKYTVPAEDLIEGVNLLLESAESIRKVCENER